jgi:hypothetical protein
MRRPTLALLATLATACGPFPTLGQKAGGGGAAVEAAAPGRLSQEAGNGAPPADASVSEAGAQSAALPGDPLDILRLPSDAMLVRTGHAALEVDSLGLALARAHELAARLGGFVAGTQAQAGRGTHRHASLELRVPTARFDELVQGLGALGSVEQVQVTTEEVGEEYTDVAARIANGRRLEARLLDLLALRTGKLQDALVVEREVARVREEIERHEARLRYLQSRAATSRLTLALHEPLPVIAGPSPIAQAARQAWRNAVELVAAAIALAGTLAPVALAAAAALWAWRRRRPALATSAPTTT